MTRIATWNLQHVPSGSPRMDVMHKRLENVAPDIAVLTEAQLDAISHLGTVFDSGHHRGTPERSRKVAIASKLPMTLVDNVGASDLPPNNFVAVDVETPAGSIRVIGIVVRYNQMREYVDALPAALHANVTARTVVAGDFNLAIPNGPLSRQLVETLGRAGLRVLTAGEHRELRGERKLKDHIAATADLETSKLLVWPRHDVRYCGGEKQLTDHAGAAVVLA